MRRDAALVLGAVVVGGLAFAALRGRPYRVPEQPVSSPLTSAKPDPASLPGSSAPDLALAASGAPASATGEMGAPELPSDAPKSISFGVIVLTYRGAENAPPDAPSKEQALAKAKALLPEAERDFDEAVKKGDHGSTADVGSMPRGVLEPSLEYALFTLKKGQVYGEPLDSPRGYWLVRRRN